MCLIYLSTTYSATCVILFFFLMIRRPPRSTLFPYTSSSDLSLENMSITPPSGSVLFWGVSQGISFRRMEVNGGMQLTTSSCGFGSGGFISDTVITGKLNSCDQQQWYTRNSSIGSWSGGSFNMVFSGVEGAPAQPFPKPPYTTLSET